MTWSVHPNKSLLPNIGKSQNGEVFLSHLAGRPATIHDRATIRWRLVFGLALMAIAAVTVCIARSATPLLSLLPSCLWFSITGVPCPTCGATRGLMALSQGHFREALLLNPLLVLVFFAVPLSALVNIGAAVQKRILIVRWNDHHLAALRWSIIALLAANWFYLLVREKFI